MATEQEILEFVIKLKMEDMKRGLNATEAEIREFHSKAAKELKGTSKEVEKLEDSGKKLSKEFDKSTKNMEQSLKGLQTSATVALAAMTASAGLTMKVFGDFQAQLNTLEAVSGATALQMEALEGKAKDLGATTKYSASQMAETSVELSKLGFVSDEIIASIDGIVAAAAASGVSLAEAGELVAGTVRGFGMDASQAVKVADVLASAANASALSMGDLALSMKYVAPIANASNQSLTDMTGIMGILANNMIKGEQAGTSLRAMMARLQNPSSEMSNIMGKLGLSIEDSEGKMKRMPVILGELRDKMEGLKDTTKSRVLGELFGTEALSAASVLMNTSNEQLGDMISKMEDSAGASKKMADIMQQGINHELALLKSAAENVAIAFGEQMSPSVEEAVKKLTAFLDLVNKIPEPVKKTATEIALLGAAVAGLGLALAGSIGGGKKLLKILKDLAAVGSKAPWLAAFLGTAALPVTIATIGSIAAANLQGSANDLNNEASDTDTDRTQGKGTQALSDANAQLRKGYEKELEEIVKLKAKYEKELTGVALDKALAGLALRQSNAAKLLGDVSILSQEQLKTSLGNVREARISLQNELNSLTKAPAQLRGLQDELKRELKKGGRSLRAAQIEKEIAGIDLVQVNKNIRATKAQLERVNAMNEKFNAALKKRDVDVKAPAPNAALENSLATDSAKTKQDEADKAQQKKTQDYFTNVDRRLKAEKDALDRAKALKIQNAQDIVQVDDALSSKMIENAQKTATAEGKCFEAVYKSYLKTFGNMGKGFALMTGGRGSGRDRNHAADAANVLPYDDRFEEVKINASNYKDVLKNTKSTAIIIYDRTSGYSPVAGHSEVYDPKTGMAYYGLGAKNRRDTMTPKQADHARMFVMKGGAPDVENVAAKEALVKLQQAYNKEIQAAIAHQAMLPKQSKAHEIAEDRIVKLKQDANSLGIDLIEAETAARKKAAELAAQLAKEQADNFKNLKQQVDSFKSSIQQRTDDLAKQFAQESMTPLEKLKDDYAREIATAKKGMAELQNAANIANLSATDRKEALDEIAKITEKINGLQGEQNKLITSAEAKEALRQKYEAMEDEIAGELRAVDAKKRRLALEVQLGQLNPEDRAKRLLEINHEELQILDKRLKKEQTLAKDQKMTEEQRKTAAERALDIEGQITETTNQQLIIAQELGEQRLQQSRLIQGEMLSGLTHQLNVMAKMVGLSEGLGTNFESVLNSAMQIADAMQVITKGKDDKGNDIDVVSKANFLDMLSVDGAGGIKGMGGQASLDASGAMAIVGVAKQLQQVVEKWGADLSGEIGRVILGDPKALKEDAENFKKEVIALENTLSEARIQQARDRGEDVSQMELDLIRKRGREELAELERQGEDIMKAKTGFLGMEYTAEERQKRKQYLDSVSQKRQEIEDRTNQAILEKRREHLSKIADAEHDAILSTQDNHLARMAFEASRTEDPLDDIAAEEARRKTDSNQKWVNDLTAARNPDLPLELQQQKEALANDAQRLRYEEIAAEMDDKRKTAAEVKKKALEINLGLLAEENALLQAQRTDDPYDDLYAALDKELKENQRAMDTALAQEGLTEAQKQEIRNNYREKELTARHKFQKTITDLQKAELQRFTDEYKTFLEQQATLIRESVEVESDKYQTLIDTEEKKLKAAEDRVKAAQEELEALQKQRDNELQAFDPEDGVQSAAFRADMAAYDPSAAAYQGVDELSNVENRDSLGTVSGETQRKGLLEQADLTERSAKNDFRREMISKQEFVKRMQEAQLMRAKAAEMELSEQELTTRRKLELEEEWANAYETYQDLARQAIDARYDVEQQRIEQVIVQREEEAAGHQKNIDTYKTAIDGLQKAAEEKIKPIEDAIKAAERSTRDWAAAWTDVTAGIAAATAAMEKKTAAAASNGGGRSQSSNVANSGFAGATGTDGKTYQTTSDLFAAMGAAKMATGGKVPPGFPNDTYPAWLSSGETVTPPLPLSEMSPGGTVNNITYHNQTTITGNHIQSDVDMYNMVSEAIRDREMDAQRNFGTQSGRWA